MTDNKSLRTRMTMDLQRQLLSLGDFNGPSKNHPLKHFGIVKILLQCKDEAAAAKQENLLIRRVGLSKLIAEENQMLEDSIKGIDEPSVYEEDDDEEFIF